MSVKTICLDMIHNVQWCYQLGLRLTLNYLMLWLFQLEIVKVYQFLLEFRLTFLYYEFAMVFSDHLLG